MVQATWEKPKISSPDFDSKSGERWKFISAGLLLLGAVAYLILSGTATGARYFITVDEVVNNTDYLGQTVRISGAVIGDTIQYDSENLILDFTVAHIPPEFDDLAKTLYDAVRDPSATRMTVHLENEVMPDLLQHEAQAILTGQLGEDGVFYASELLLKCPSRYEEAAPDQVIANHGGE